MDFHKRNTEPKSKRKESPKPEVIAGHRILRFMEKGGMSHVYLGSEETTGALVVIKTLAPDLLKDEEVKARFFKEADIIERTDHPNIVKLFSHGEWEGGVFLAMEYVEGMSLKKLLVEAPPPLSKALKILLEIAYALCHLHAQGIIHRDLKLENILLTEEGKVKVIDFGIAHIEGEEISSSGNRRVIGTPIYMSPEQRLNPQNVSFPSDIYSLGIIAYELILGRLCHGKVHLSLLPKGLQPILAKTVNPLPGERYQDVVDLITDLSAYVNKGEPEAEERSFPLELYEEMEKERKALFGSYAPLEKRFEVQEKKKLSQRSPGLLTRFTETEAFLISPSQSGAKGFFELLAGKKTATTSWFKITEEGFIDYQMGQKFSLWILSASTASECQKGAHLKKDEMLLFVTLSKEEAKELLESVPFQNEPLDSLATKLFSLLSQKVETLYFLLLRLK